MIVFKIALRHKCLRALRVLRGYNIQMIKKILEQPQNHLARLMDKVNYLSDLNQRFHAILDPKLAKHCQIANLKNEQLVVVADSSSWATKIRYGWAIL